MHGCFRPVNSAMSNTRVAFFHSILLRIVIFSVINFLNCGISFEAARDGWLMVHVVW